MLAAFVLRHYSVKESPFANLRQVLAFVGGACVMAPAAASLIPAYVYVRRGWAPDLSDAWFVRFISNAVATLTLVPSLMMVWHFLSASAESTAPTDCVGAGVDVGDGGVLVPPHPASIMAARALPAR